MCHVQQKDVINALLLDGTGDGFDVTPLVFWQYAQHLWLLEDFVFQAHGSSLFEHRQRV